MGAIKKVKDFNTVKRCGSVSFLYFDIGGNSCDKSLLVEWTCKEQGKTRTMGPE